MPVSKKLKQKRTQAGMCTRCGKNPPSPNRQQCDTCRDYIAKIYSESTAPGRSITRKNRKLIGLCSCGKQAEVNKKHCTGCLQSQLKSVMKKYYRAKNSGVCVHCQTSKAIQNWASCEQCKELNKIRMAKKRLEAFQNNICGICFSETVFDGSKGCNKCRIIRKQLELTRESLNLCVRCGKSDPTATKLCKKCDERRIDRNLEMVSIRRERKRETFNKYGGCFCKCCGETEFDFLTVDHINNDGAAHRREMGNRNLIHRWLQLNNYPEGFQILCMNCNWAKGCFGTCPHQRPQPLLVVTSDQPS